MSQAGRRTSLFYQHQQRQHRIQQIQVVVFVVFCLIVVILGFHQAVSKSSARSSGTLNQLQQKGTGEPNTSIGSQDAGLHKVIADWAQDHSFSATVQVQELTGAHRAASYHADQSIVTASTFKLYVAYGILYGVEHGTYSLGQTTNDGDSIDTDMRDMIINSDNDAARTLGFMLGWAKLDNLLASQGMTHTNTDNYIGSSTTPVGDKKSTATDLATFLEKLYAGKLLNRADTSYLLRLLENQSYQDGIPAGVPSGTTVADKPGWLTPADGIYEYVDNDAGIVYGPKSTYVLVVTTTGSSMDPVADLSQLVYAYLEK